MPVGLDVPSDVEGRVVLEEGLDEGGTRHPHPPAEKPQLVGELSSREHLPNMGNEIIRRRGGAIGSSSERHVQNHERLVLVFVPQRLAWGQTLGQGHEAG